MYSEFLRYLEYKKNLHIYLFSFFKISQKLHVFKNCGHSLLSYTKYYNLGQTILRLFDVLPNFSFTTSKMMRDYYLQTWYIPVASRVAKQLKSYDVRKLGNIRKVSKLHRMIP